MNERIKLIIEYQKTKNDEIFKEVISHFKRIMYCHLKMIPKIYKEDVYQEMLMVIYEYIIHYEIKPIHLLVENFNKENFIKLKESNFSNVNQIFNHSYLSAFFQKYETNLFKRAFIQKDALNNFLYEYELFCNESQLFRYMNKKLKYVCCDFMRKYKKLEIISLDTLDDASEYMVDNSKSKMSFFENLDLSEDEIQFLRHFIHKGRKVTEMEVAKELGISQQAVHKRKKKIVEKYKIRKKWKE